MAADRNRNDELCARAQRLREAGAEVRLGVADLSNAVCGASGRAPDVCVVSPGIAADCDWLAPVRESGIPLLSELELGADRCRSPMIAVTGSNGKSTFVKFCGLALEMSGCNVALAGNYDIPLCSVALDERGFDWVVAEVSSFQLETVRSFCPRIAVLLNIQPDHLDRHGDMDAYVGLKARIFDGLGPGNVAVVHDRALDLVKERTGGKPEWRTFGSGPDADYRYRDGEIAYRENGRSQLVSVKGTVFCNDVMGLTAAAVLAVSLSAGIPASGIEAAAKRYEPLPHRMEDIGTKGGIRFIDDSKATNLGAMCGALRMVNRPVRLIAGGILKEGSLENAKEMLVKAARRIYLTGQSAIEMEKAWGETVGCTVCGNLEEAVRTAWDDSEEGEIIMLSPGCASFDQFRDYNDRGERFKEIVESVTEGEDTYHEN